jgi:hypothetical protein
MGAIMEVVFCICYLVGACAMGVIMLRQSRGNRQRRLFAALTLILAGGDAFHLVPRIYGLLTDKIDEIPVALGFGTLVTSITMTIFYVMLYHFWQRRFEYNKNKYNKNKALTIWVYALAAARVLACLHPANDWFSADSPLMWGIIRNIPFALLGAVIVVLFARTSKSDKFFRFAWLAVLLSFLFYLPVVLFAGVMPIIGMLMLPKTICYVWLIIMGYKGTQV